MAARRLGSRLRIPHTARRTVGQSCSRLVWTARNGEGLSGAYILETRLVSPSTTDCNPMISPETWHSVVGTASVDSTRVQAAVRSDDFGITTIAEGDRGDSNA